MTTENLYKDPVLVASFVLDDFYIQCFNISNSRVMKVITSKQSLIPPDFLSTRSLKAKTRQVFMG